MSVVVKVFDISNLFSFLGLKRKKEEKKERKKSKERLGNGWVGHLGLVLPDLKLMRMACVLVYFIDEDWLWVLLFLVLCF